MRRFIFLPLLLLAVITIFGQSRPKSDGNLQKANRRPPPTATPTPSTTENQPAPENQPATTSTDLGAVQPSADSAENNPSDGEVLRINTNLVTIPVKVSDRGGRFIGNLSKENFQVFEDGKPQEIAYFSNTEEPFTVALVLDMSYSSTFKIGEIQAAAIAFVNQLHPKDKIMVVSFDEEVRVLSEPTNNRQILQSAIRSTQIASGTSLYEAIDLVINKRLKNITGRKAVVLFTDGVDTTSKRIYAADNLRDVYETDSLIYPIEYDTFRDVQAIKNNPTARIPQQKPFPSPLPPSSTGTRSPFPFPFPLPPSVMSPDSRGTSAEDYQRAAEYLQQLADSTSGRIYKASTTANLADAFKNIADELRQIYSLGFYPVEEKAGKRRQLKVRVNQIGAVVRARDSYVVGKKEKNKK